MLAPIVCPISLSANLLIFGKSEDFSITIGIFGFIFIVAMSPETRYSGFFISVPSFLVFEISSVNVIGMC